MPRLIRLYIQSVAIGFGLSAGFVAALLGMDVASVGGLVIGAGAMGWVAVAMLVVFFGILFSGVQFAIRIMLMAESDDGPRGGLRGGLRSGLRQQQLVPVRVEARAKVDARANARRNRL